MGKTKLVIIILLFIKERKIEDMLLSLTWRKMCKNKHRIETNARSVCQERGCCLLLRANVISKEFGIVWQKRILTSTGSK